MKLHPFNGMAVRRVRLKESWVCERAGLQPVGAGTVESLALQGTYREKIVSLGDAFKNFQSLRSLDLSRNIIISLQGIEYLHSLGYLNLYYNDIASLEEVKHLKRLAQLKTLDLRLNPVTRQNADYRLFVIHIAGTLETLDERPVRESERKNATYNFQLKSQETSESGSSMHSPSRSHLYGDRGGAKAHLDFGLSNMTEMGRTNSQEQHSRDYTRGSSPSKYQSEEHQSYLQPQTDFEDEYRPLPSPTRSSLRSPGLSSRPKEGHRVTFADSTMSEFFPKQEDISTPMKNQDDIGSTKHLGFSYPDKLGTAFSFKNTYLTSTPVRKDAAGSERMRASTLDGNERIRSGDINDIGQSSEMRDRLKPSHNGGEESSRERLLRLSSDLYITTHMADPPASSSSLSALRKGFSDISKTYTLPSKPTLSNAHFTAKTAELCRDYKSAWNPEKSSTSNLTQSGMKRSSSLNSLISPKPSDLYSDLQREDLLSENEPKKRESSPSRSETSSISDVLQQLMDLVDRYWNGSGSLLHNQRFLVPARELLTKLTTSDSAKQMFPLGDQLRGSRNSYGALEDGDSMESIKLRLIKVMEENHFLRSKVHKLENQVARRETGGHLPLMQDDLRQKYEQLSLQVESLQQQLSKTNKLQETVNVLHNSQRSLVSTNEYLLQQLNKISPSMISKLPRSPPPQRISTDKYQAPEPSNVPGLTPAYSTSQYRNPERLSACPL
ncbi:leucine-rich repeat-containing protein 36 isoform X2 [Rana temporaria]|uniref:leucine-rich repeat-containing protein 36 isoform X2 n=1 Tax=Rana temporaria TaxID=8407 RepID=UPI001AAC5989|nr:leucine-rich repeat-containing protein 36 isoform X2 [Rana temporaria]